MALHLSPKKAALFLAGLFLLIMAAVAASGGYYLARPAGKVGGDTVFLVNPGSTLAQVGRALEKRGIIKKGVPFILWAWLTGHGNSIKAGEYRLSPAMTPLEILGRLNKGAIITHAVTIPEGFSSRQIGDLLEKMGLLEHHAFMSLVGNSEMARDLDISGRGLEGFLYPDTYRLGRGLSARSIVSIMVKRFWEVVGPLKEDIQRSGMSVEQVVTLASIVEKETGRAGERPIIASVFLNRLKKGMRLESDPTVIYGMDDFSGNLTRKDLAQPTPYNTYVIRGLPPGPISNPGLEAIKAVIYPAKTDYLFFVSKNDGSHHFSKTLVEHNRAVDTYQKKRQGRRKHLDRG